MEPITIQAERVTSLVEHERIPISFEVRRVLEVEGQEAPEGFRLVERDVRSPYVKNYDVDGESPTRSVVPFDLTNWVLLVARIGEERVGGAILAFDTPGVDMLEGRSDLAVVWDLRVAPGHRRQGVGTLLWRAAAHWARGHACRQLKVETQNINVPACRFYERQGCRLGRVTRGAYAGLPHEAQLLWYVDL
jgi:GNAT superfamily N-acetyltransferase